MFLFFKVYAIAITILFVFTVTLLWTCWQEDRKMAHDREERLKKQVSEFRCKYYKTSAMYNSIAKEYKEMMKEAEDD